MGLISIASQRTPPERGFGVKPVKFQWNFTKRTSSLITCSDWIKHPTHHTRCQMRSFNSLQHSCALTVWVHDAQAPRVTMCEISWNFSEFHHTNHFKTVYDHHGSPWAFQIAKSPKNPPRTPCLSIMEQVRTPLGVTTRIYTLTVLWNFTWNFTNFRKNQRSSGVCYDLIEIRPMDTSVSWNTSFDI